MIFWSFQPYSILKSQDIVGGPPLCNITDIRTYARVKGDEKGVRGKSIKHKRHKTS